MLAPLFSNVNMNSIFSIIDSNILQLQARRGEAAAHCHSEHPAQCHSERQRRLVHESFAARDDHSNHKRVRSIPAGTSIPNCVAIWPTPIEYFGVKALSSSHLQLPTHLASPVAGTSHPSVPANRASLFSSHHLRSSERLLPDTGILLQVELKESVC